MSRGASRWRNWARQQTWLRYAIGALVSLFLLVLAFWGVQWGDLLRSLRDVDLPLILLATMFLLGSLVARAMRWQALLSSLVRIPLGDALSYTLIGYLVNNVIGLRLGEVARAGLLGEKRHISKAGVFATVVVERVLDMLALLVLVALLAVLLDLSSVVRTSILVGETVAAAAALVLVLLAWWGQDLGKWIPRSVPGAIRTRLVGLLVGFVEGLQVLRSGRRLLLAVAWTLCSWGLFTVSVILFLWATGLNVPWYAALLVIVVTNLGSAIPSSPGFVGGYHFLAVFALSFWPVARSDALGFAVLVHGINYVAVTGLGVLALWRENIAFSQLRRQTRHPGDTLVPKENL